MKSAEDIVREKGGHILSIPSGASVQEAMIQMVRSNVGSIVIMKAGQPVGTWTPRELLRDMVAGGFDPKNSRIDDHMNPCPCTAPHTDTPYNLMDKFLGLRVNHVLIEKAGEFIGLLSVGDAMKAAIQEKTEDLEHLNSMVSWEYYEEWKWKPEKRKKK